VAVEKSPRDSQYITRKIVGQNDLNPHGTLFGGVMMSWMDEVAYGSARKYAGRPTCVTVNIDNIVFLSPVQLGEVVVLTSQVNYVGSSSMEIGVRVEKENPYTNELVHTNSAYLTFVALGRNNKPAKVPALKLETEDDFRRFEEARLRIKVRNRIKAALKRKLEKDMAKEKSQQMKTFDWKSFMPLRNLRLKVKGYLA
jgi:acyl-CoA hydrolase